jgi:hypothetical protein
MDQVEESQRLLHLVALQSADHVPAYAGQPRRRRLSHRFLNVVLADVPGAGLRDGA